MTTSLTPALALAHLSELSVDVRAAVVLDASGEALAGDTALAPAARGLLAADETRRRVDDGILLAARAPDGRALAVLAGNFALLPLLEHDIAALARDLSEPPETRNSP